MGLYGDGGRRELEMAGGNGADEDVVIGDGEGFEARCGNVQHIITRGHGRDFVPTFFIGGGGIICIGNRDHGIFNRAVIVGAGNNTTDAGRTGTACKDLEILEGKAFKNSILIAEDILSIAAEVHQFAVDLIVQIDEFGRFTRIFFARGEQVFVMDVELVEGLLELSREVGGHIEIGAEGI